MAEGKEGPPLRRVATAENKLLTALKMKLPETTLPRWSGIINPALYGMTTHADVFNPRQRVVILALLKALHEENEKLKKELELLKKNKK